MFRYDNKRWKKKREKILKRDGYLCRESKRYGKRVGATTVHHIYPAEAYPEYAWCVIMGSGNLNCRANQFVAANAQCDARPKHGSADGAR